MKITPFFIMNSPILKFISLTVRNFLATGNAPQTLQLDEANSVLILGRNLDNGGSGSSNGVGKTTLINALCYVLYNKPFDNISLNRLINSTNASKNTLMEVSLKFEKDGHTYEIYRARGEDYRISVTRDGEDITPGKGVHETDAIIVGIIGMSYELFTKTVIFSGNAPAFLELPIAQQRTQIEELFNISLLSEKAVILKDQIRNTESDIKIAEALINQQQGAITQYQRQLRDAENRVKNWESKQASTKTELQGLLAELDTVDIDAQQAYHKERDALKLQLNGVTANLTTSKKDVKTFTKALEKLLDEQEHLADAKCPYCSQAFHDAPAKLQEIETLITKDSVSLESTEATVAQLEAEKAELDAQLKTLNKKITHADLDELIDARTNKSTMEAKLAEMETAINPHTDALNDLVGEGEPVVDTTTLNALKKLADHQAFLLKLLTDKNSFLRRRIINKTIPVLNSRLNHYTLLVGLPHEVKFDADMSCTVTEFDRELDFGNLSAGEKKRVNTAMSLAFRDVLHHLHSKINLLMVDELDGALDQQGIDSVISVLKNKARDEGISTFVISHHPSVHGRLDRNLIVQKENGFSSFGYE